MRTRNYGLSYPTNYLSNRHKSYTRTRIGTLLSKFKKGEKPFGIFEESKKVAGRASTKCTPDLVSEAQSCIISDNRNLHHSQRKLAKKHNVSTTVIRKALKKTNYVPYKMNKICRTSNRAKTLRAQQCQWFLDARATGAFAR